MGTDEASTVSSDTAPRRRGFLSSAIISFFFTAFAGFLWIGRGRLALLYLGVAGGLLIAGFVAVLSGLLDLGPPVPSEFPAAVFPNPYSDIAALAVSIASVLLVLAFIPTSEPTRWYSRGWMVLPAALAFFGTIAIAALLVRTLAFHPFSIVSSSMAPGMVAGDYVAASKWPYGYSRHSLPFSAISFDGRVLEKAPERGDLIVFKYPRDVSLDYVERVIGLPGERIQMIGGVVHVDGRPINRVQAGLIDDEELTGSPEAVAVYRETLPNGVSYDTLDRGADGPLDNTREIVVADGMVFVLGDNRDNSADSRVWGLVPFENLVGRVDRIFWNSRGTPIGDRSTRIEQGR
ncbi:signal peptidase I [Mesorhizobium sp. J428]|uniref:signal peptidase I n=1 Tax=Mesorhizobium sp. J428 TaxID=2898440 RepID=UPI0021514439|nr:signal peptidase I [Mesorhizobium sp. J428]MCR5856920.1 signal peptidase I [Mesorhizobium sp. J428]